MLYCYIVGVRFNIEFYSHLLLVSRRRQKSGYQRLINFVSWGKDYTMNGAVSFGFVFKRTIRLNEGFMAVWKRVQVYLYVP